MKVFVLPTLLPRPCQPRAPAGSGEAVRARGSSSPAVLAGAGRLGCPQCRRTSVLWCRGYTPAKAGAPSPSPTAVTCRDVGGTFLRRPGPASSGAASRRRVGSAAPGPGEQEEHRPVLPVSVGSRLPRRCRAAGTCVHPRSVRLRRRT